MFLDDICVLGKLYAKVVMENLFHHRRWHSKNAVDLYLEGSWFKSWLVIVTAFYRRSFLSHSEQFVELCIDWLMTQSYTVLYMTALLNNKPKKKPLHHGGSGIKI